MYLNILHVFINEMFSFFYLLQCLSNLMCPFVLDPVHVNLSFDKVNTVYHAIIVYIMWWTVLKSMEWYMSKIKNQHFLHKIKQIYQLKQHILHQYDILLLYR